MGEGLNFPVFRYNGFWPSLSRALGQGGMDVTPHVWVALGPRASFINTVIKYSLLVLYGVAQLYIYKGYLDIAHIQGTTRLQLQHPVQNCNPLDKGCKANFSDYDVLPYCSQHKAHVDSSRIGRQETCEYLDEFDMKLPGYQQSNMIIPTRRSLYTKKQLCSGRTGPCKQKYEYLHNETLFVADIESFTLLIDHSVVCPDLGRFSKTAWEMVGLYNPCGKWDYLDSLEKDFESDREQKCKLQPIRRAAGLREPEQEVEAESVTWAMWMEQNWYNTFLPFLQDYKQEASSANSPFTKISEGDVISVKDILDVVDAGLDEPTEGNKTRRYDGMVVAIDIEYRNYKPWTWPNRLAPVYTYSFRVSPAAEYKVMNSYNEDEQRYLQDEHGIYIIVTTSGRLGTFSLVYVFGMVLGAMAIESVQRYIMTMYALNSLEDEHADELQQAVVRDVSAILKNEKDYNSLSGLV